MSWFDLPCGHWVIAYQRGQLHSRFHLFVFQLCSVVAHSTIYRSYKHHWQSRVIAVKVGRATTGINCKLAVTSRAPDEFKICVKAGSQYTKIASTWAEMQRDLKWAKIGPRNAKTSLRLAVFDCWSSIGKSTGREQFSITMVSHD